MTVPMEQPTVRAMSGVSSTRSWIARCAPLAERLPVTAQLLEPPAAPASPICSRIAASCSAIPAPSFFHSAPGAITINKASEYRDALKKYQVIVDGVERRSVLTERVRKIGGTATSKPHDRPIEAVVVQSVEIRRS